MNNYTEFLLDKIFELRELYKNGEFSQSAYEDMVTGYIESLARYTTEFIENGYVS